MEMSFIAGTGLTNVDLLYQNMPKIPGVGEEVYTDEFSIQLGGGMPATLINIGRLGIETKIATHLGSDMFSEFAKKQYENNNVDILNLYDGSSIPVNITSAVILENDRSFISYGCSENLSGERAQEAFYNMAKGAKICLMQPDGMIDVYRKLKSEGTIMVLDMGWDDELSFEKYKDFFETADYYTPNRKEAEKLTGCDDPEKAAEALTKYFDRVIVKADKDGCFGIDGDDRFFCPSIDDFLHIDSTGAGDAFLAGLCYGLFYNYPLKDCIEFGNITGGKAVTSVGALSAYITEDELLEIKSR